MKVEDGNVLAEKGRFSRFICKSYRSYYLFIRCDASFLPSMYVDETLWLRDGETKEIPGTDGQYYLKVRSL